MDRKRAATAVKINSKQAAVGSLMTDDHSTYRRNHGYKPWFDTTILIVSHIVFSPLIILLWTSIPLLIWLDDKGPVFYKQQRVGKGGRIFSVLKFRTMVINADITGPAWTTEKDPRVTRVGKYLRRTALDELPEVLNIWRGEMSLVGPRALDVSEHRTLEQEIPGFEHRLETLPGLTGLAQIYNPSDDAQHKFKYDLEYLRRMSPTLDLKLLVLSICNTLVGKWDRRRGKPPAPTSQPKEINPDDCR